MENSVAVPWFSERDFFKLFEMLDDLKGESLTYEQWMGDTQERIDEQADLGRYPFLVYVNPAHFEEWVHGEALPLTSRSIAVFAHQLLCRILGTDEGNLVIL